jgi:peptidyl-prolyl cis-trans isomerase A (cyclophilin A)
MTNAIQENKRMKISKYKVTIAVLAMALGTSLVSAQTGTQTPPPAKKPAASTATKSMAAAKPAGPGYDKALLTPALLKAKAPDDFSVKFVTTKGDFTVQVTRAWAPLGADRFYNLAKHHFFDGVTFFRVIPGFVAQFGISSFPAVAKAWDGNAAQIKDDPVIRHNTKGTLVVATSGPNTRSTQLFINYGDNSRLDASGFSPFGEVTDGMDVVLSFYGGYGDAGAPDQEKMTAQGKAYTDAGFPKLDSVKTATVIEAPRPAATPAKKPAPKPAPKPATTPKPQGN